MSNLMLLEIYFLLAVVAAIYALFTGPGKGRLLLLVLGLLIWILPIIFFGSDYLFYIDFLNIVIRGSFIGNTLWFWAGGIAFSLRKNRGKSAAGDDIREILNVIPVLRDNPAELKEKAQAKLYRKMETILDQLISNKKINVQLIQSSPYDETALVGLTISVPYDEEATYSDNLFNQSSILIGIEPQPFRKYGIIYGIRIETSYKTKEFNDVCELNEQQLSHLVKQLISGERWKYKPMRLRKYPFQFWRPKQKVEGYVERTLPDIIMAAFPPLLIFPLLRRLILGKRQILRLSAGKPKYEPRVLLPLDSWQVSVKGLQSYGNQLKEEFTNEIRKVTADMGEINEENIWYWGVDGKVERKQIVFRVGRGFVFIKIYDYAEDLFVGWEANVNTGTWEEECIGSGYTKGSQMPLDAYTISNKWHSPNEFDISDANFALETTHATLVKLIKRLVEEKKIDQEIDFSILRESRSSVLNAEAPEDKKEKKSRFFRSN